MRGVKREIAACVATLETLYDQIPEMITHQVQIYLAKLIDQQRKVLPLLNSIDEDKTAPGSQMKKQLEDLRAIQRNLLRKLALRFNTGQSTASYMLTTDFRCLRSPAKTSNASSLRARLRVGSGRRSTGVQSTSSP